MIIKLLSVVLFFNFSLMCAQSNERVFCDNIQSCLDAFTSTEVEISEEARIDDNIAEKIRNASEQSQIVYKQTLLKSWEVLSRVRVSSSKSGLILPSKDCRYYKDTRYSEHTRLSNVVIFLDEKGQRRWREDDVAIVERLDEISLLYDDTYRAYFYCLCEYHGDSYCYCCCDRRRLPTEDQLNRERQLLVNALFNRLKTIQEQTSTMNSSIVTAIQVESLFLPSAPFMPTTMEMDRSEESFFSKN